MAPSATPSNPLPKETTRSTFPWRCRNRAQVISYGLPFPQLAAAHVQRLNRSRVFALVSRSLAKNTDNFDRLKACFGEKLVGTHVGLTSHVPWNEVLVLVKEVQECKADIVVTLGGGSITDAMKLVTLIIANSWVKDYGTFDLLSRKLLKSMTQDVDYATSSIDPADIHPATISMINIPTTLSAGEYSPYAGGTNPVDGVKRMFIHQTLYADVVILDPILVSTVPEWVWMSSGVRSIDHCVETMGSLVVNDEQTKEAAEEGLVLLARGLLKLRKDPMDTQSRLDTQLGSVYAMDGVFTLVLPMPLGINIGTMNVTHGHTSCVLCPTVMKYNARLNSDRQKRALDALWADSYIAKVLSQRGLSREKSDLGDMLDGLFREFGMPRTLKDVGVEGEANMKILAKRSLEDPWCVTNPIPVTTEEQVMEILRKVET